MTAKGCRSWLNWLVEPGDRYLWSIVSSELVEKALYRRQQKADETGDSFIARVDVVWTELLTKDINMEQIMAYVLLRGSRLSAEGQKECSGRVRC